MNEELGPNDGSMIRGFDSVLWFRHSFVIRHLTFVIFHLRPCLATNEDLMFDQRCAASRRANLW